MGSIDPQTLGRLYRQHAPALRLYARQWDCGEDLVQDAFVQLAQQSPPPEHVLAWLYCVVRNQARADARTAGRRRRREQGASSPEAWFAAADDQLDAREAARRLAELPLELREAVIARLWGGLTFEQIAHLAGCSVATAHRRYEAALAQMRERLEGRWNSTPPSPTAKT
jgi:RNA polymerase sigma-70 factor (ECF subfamily)